MGQVPEIKRFDLIVVSCRVQQISDSW